jgi:Ser/Thr protein kinase RdoA (MazF antagonist)
LPAPPRHLVWSIGSAPSLRPLVGLLETPRTRDLAERAFENFERNALPLIGQFRRQIIHCDFNGNNVLVDAPDARRICGVIDFGDLTCGPLAHELAVAASRHCAPDDPVPGILWFCSGYASAIPLQPAEARALFDLICLRPAMRMAFWAGEAAKAGGLLTPEIEFPEASILANLLDTDARRHIEKCVMD